METGSVLDAVEQAVRTMEVDTEFNAGYGGVLTREGNVEMDACMMDGNSMKVGAVTGVQDIYHLITLARAVMEKTEYNFLGSIGANALAKSQGFQILKPGSLISDNARAALERWRNATGIGKFDVCNQHMNLFFSDVSILRSEKEIQLVQLLSIQMEI